MKFGILLPFNNFTGSQLNSQNSGLYLLNRSQIFGFYCYSSSYYSYSFPDRYRVCGRRGVMDKSLALYPGVPSSIPGSTSLSDGTLSYGPVF